MPHPRRPSRRVSWIRRADGMWMNMWWKWDEQCVKLTSLRQKRRMDGRISSYFGPSFSIWIGLVSLECVVGPFLSSGRAERPTIIDLLRQSCGRGYDSCRWGRRSGGVICLEKNLNRNLVGFAFCCSRLGEVLCNFTSGDREEVWKSFEIGGGALPLGYFFQSWESLYFLVSAIFCEVRNAPKCKKWRCWGWSVQWHCKKVCAADMYGDSLLWSSRLLVFPSKMHRKEDF